MKSRILFVDDEPNILSALRRMFYDMRGEWDMAFASGGAEALAMIAEKPFDVVVSDMRMPGMDGAALLEEVRRVSPQSVRMILSGHSDREMIIRTVKPAHQFLSKPVQADELRAMIRRALGLKHFFLDEGIKGIVSRLDALPAVPDIYLKLSEELAGEDASSRNVAALIARDMALSAGILKLVNSAFFGQRERVASIVHAVNLLGIEIIKSLILYLDLFSKFDKSFFSGFNLELLWSHSLTTAMFAKTIAAAEGAGERLADDCYIGGLLHDVGKIVLAGNLKEQYAAILAQCRTENRSVLSEEKQALPASHAEVGGYLLGLWGLTDQVVAAVFNHHVPARVGSDCFTALTAVHAANYLAHELVVINPGFAVNPLDATYLEACGLAGRLDAWRAACAATLPKETPDGR